tara:strand:- start:4683 stop:4931 length:249 start_codon:yes stop_codon:yes gene_type:complete
MSDIKVEDYVGLWNQICDTLVENDRDDLVDFLELVKTYFEDGTYICLDSSDSESDCDEDPDSEGVKEDIEPQVDDQGFYSLK